MGAQLAAAEKLSECLRKQMAALNVQCPAKKQNLRRELFETLGLTYDGASYNSPSNQKASDTLTKQLLKTSCSSVSAKELSCRNQYTPVKASESESVRRRRDSLDQVITLCLWMCLSIMLAGPCWYVSSTFGLRLSLSFALFFLDRGWE